MPWLDVQRTVSALAPATWDALAEGDILASHRWLRVLEQTALPRADPRYVLLGEGDTLLGAAVCYRHERTPSGRTLDNVLLGKLRGPASRMGISFLPALVCGPYKSQGRQLLLSPFLSPNDRERAAEKLLDAVEELAASEGLPLVFWKVLESGMGLELATRLSQRGYLRTLQSPVAVLDVVWSSFDDYLVERRRRHRNIANQIRRELRTAEKMGLEIRVLADPAQYRDRLYELADRHYRRLNGVLFPFEPAVFERIGQLLGSDAVVYGGFEGSQLVGFVLDLRSGGTAHTIWVGIDESWLRRGALYFNLSFNRPILDAIRDGTKRMHFGNQLYELKMRRGCRVESVSLFHRSRSPVRQLALRPWFALQARRKGRRQRKWVSP